MTRSQTTADREKSTEPVERLNFPEKQNDLIDQLTDVEGGIRQSDLEHVGINHRRPPVLRIPIELTASIFRMAVEPSAEEVKYYSFEDRTRMKCEMSCRLSHVCQTWYSIALSLSDIWTTLVYTGQPSDSDRFIAYLGRSRNQLVNLFFVVAPDKDILVFRNLLALARKHMQRWKSFILYFSPATEYRPDFLSSIFGHPFSASNLESFEILVDAHMVGDIPYVPPVRSFFRGCDAPKLKQTSCDSYTFIACMPFSNITTLQIGHVHQSSMKYPFSFLRDVLTSSHLVNLSITGDVFYISSKGSRTVLAPELHHFRFAACKALASNIFQLLIAPKLKLLILAEVDVDESWTFPSTKKFEHFPSLHTVGFVHCRVVLSCAKQLADLTKNVTTLYITNSPDDCEPHEDLFSVIADASPETILWPQLSALHCRTYIRAHKSEQMQRFLDAITWRRETLSNHCVLKIARDDVSEWTQFHPEFWERLVGAGFYEEWIADPELEGRHSAPWPARPRLTSSWYWDNEFLI